MCWIDIKKVDMDIKEKYPIATLITWHGEGHPPFGVVVGYNNMWNTDYVMVQDTNSGREIPCRPENILKYESTKRRSTDHL